ncbi:MAG: hypothetical protein U1F60_11045 [Planctomycetota bacterium]
MTKNLAEELQRTARQALAGLQPVAQGDEMGGLPFRRLLAAAFRGRYLLFATTLLGLLIGLFMAITTVNSYVSEGRFQFTATGAERLRVDPTSASQTSQEMMAAGATYILNTNDLLERVVKRLGPARILQPYEPGIGEENGLKSVFFGIQRDWNMTREEDRTPEAALRYLKRAIVVDLPRYTGIVVATCTANNPELAREILAVWMDEAVKWHLEKYDDTKSYDAAKKSHEDSIVALDAAERALSEFMLRKAEVASFDGEKERIEIELGAARGRESNLKEQIRVTEEEIKQRKEQLDGPNALPRTVTIKVKKSSASEEVIAEVRRQMIDAEIALRNTQLIEKSPDSSEIRRAKNTLESLRGLVKDMEEERKLAPEVDEEVDNPLIRAAQTEIPRLELQLVGDRARLTAAIADHADKEKQLRRLLEIEPEYSRLLKAKLEADSNNRSAQVLWSAAQQKRDLSLGNFSSLKSIQDASLPLEKEGPNRGKLILGAFLVGLFLGLGLLVLRALPDDVVRTRDDLERIDGLAVIGVMPRIDGKNLRRHTALREQGW